MTVSVHTNLTELKDCEQTLLASHLVFIESTCPPFSLENQPVF